MQINNNSLTDLFRGYRVLFNEAFQGAPVMTDVLTTPVPSKNNEEKLVWLGAIPGMKELVGPLAIENVAAHNYTIVNKEWISTLAVKESDIENDNYGLYNPMFQAMGIAGKQHQDELVTGLLANGFSQLCYTGKNFFDQNHEPQKGKATFTNKRTDKLGQTGFRQARADLKGRVNAWGRPMGLGRKLQLVVSPANEALGRSIVQADLAIQSVSGNGTAGVTNVDKGTAELIVLPYLSATPDMWFLLEAGLPFRPLIWQTNLPTRLTALTNPQSDHVFKNHEYLYQGYGRYNAGYGLPELAIGSNGTTNAL